MKILLISFQPGLETIGLRHLHYFLLKNGHDSAILYLSMFKGNNFRESESLRRFVQEMNPGLVGISLMSTEYHAARDVTMLLKDRLGSVPVIWGGIHPTLSPNECLAYADYVCMGEGEKTLLDIANALDRGLDLKDIRNLCYLGEAGMIKNSLYPYIKNLDDLPLCDCIPVNSFIFTGTRIEKLGRKNFSRFARYSGRVYSIMKSRGCPFSCRYCCNNALRRIYTDNPIRMRSAENVIKEIEHVLRDCPKIEYINFQDDCFLASPENELREFCDLYKQRVKKPFVIRAIPTFVTKDKVKMLQGAGLSWMMVGLQSGSDRVCKEVYKRHISRSDFFETVTILNDCNLPATYDVITDNPFETERDKLETVETLMKLPKPFYLQCLSLVLYPGTELFEEAQSAFPQYCEQYYTKDYQITCRDRVNDLIRIAAFVDEA
ncbi:MAG: B12-binding domain-containing radical SAM protein, partial [Candidatus Omnitrophica bacterium]|nr:B12-binding domain-containing radical SAM protein [Candidatus Omnitrophota bacterium]